MIKFPLLLLLLLLLLDEFIVNIEKKIGVVESMDKEKELATEMATQRTTKKRKHITIVIRGVVMGNVIKTMSIFPTRQEKNTCRLFV